jgi:DNA-binding winged helix-turn-helix (wHTH) protein
MVELGDRAFELLLALIDARGEAISKDRLMTLVWPGRIVEENTLESQISILRRALGDDRSAIRSVAGRGHQFIGKLKDAARPQLSSELSPAPTVDLLASASTRVGRNTVLREITELAAAHRLITRVGSGGVGKTRLAIESARQLAPRFPGRVCLAALASTGSGEFLPMTVARALGFPPGEGTRRLIESLRAFRTGTYCLCSITVSI